MDGRDIGTVVLPNAEGKDISQRGRGGKGKAQEKGLPRERSGRAPLKALSSRYAAGITTI